MIPWVRPSLILSSHVGGEAGLKTCSFAQCPMPSWGTGPSRWLIGCCLQPFLSVPWPPSLTLKTASLGSCMSPVDVPPQDPATPALGLRHGHLLLQGFCSRPGGALGRTGPQCPHCSSQEDSWNRCSEFAARLLICAVLLDYACLSIAVKLS